MSQCLKSLISEPRAEAMESEMVKREIAGPACGD